MKIVRLSAFAVLSGIGWLIDFSIFNFLVANHHSNLKSNIISASVAVAFVFITARRWIFLNHVGHLRWTIGKYIVWNCLAITAASYLLKLTASGLNHLDFHDIIVQFGPISALPISKNILVSNAAKLLVTPLTMYANFIAMGYIFERKVSLL